MIFAELRGGEFGEDEFAGGEHTEEGADGVEGLGEIEALGSGLFVTHREDVGVGGGFEEGETEGENVEGEGEPDELHGEGGGDEEQGTGGVEGKAKQNTGFIGVFLNEEGGGNCHGGVASVESELDGAALRVA